jgi:predicted component of type VI protein secretion system
MDSKKNENKKPGNTLMRTLVISSNVPMESINQDLLQLINNSSNSGQANNQNQNSKSD